MYQPKISIITICYNSDATIEETIKSVVEQDYENFEYLIIDGGSTDRTMEIINRYKERISLIISEHDKGISDAFNKGISYASGDVIGIINSDDLLCKGAMRAIANHYAPQVDVFRGNLIIENRQTGQKYLSRPSMKLSLYRNSVKLCHTSTFITKKAYTKWGSYRVDFRYMMDGELLHRFYQSGAKFKYVNEVLATFRLGGRTADSWENKIQEYKKMLVLNKCPKWQLGYNLTSYTLYNKIKTYLVKIFGDHLLKLIKYERYRD